MTTIPALRAQGLTIAYGRRVIVRDIDLAVPEGSVYVLLGRNGSGKTSLVRCLVGHQKTRSGTACLFGIDAWTERHRAMRRAAVVPETPDAPPHMTIPQLLALCRALHPSFDERETTARLRRFEVPMNVRFDGLSRGHRGAVMLSLALGSRPELLVLDDPTLGLDVVARRWLFDELVGELADRKVTVFATTHDLATFEGLADRVGILADGRLALEDDMEALRTRYRRPAPPGDTPEVLSLEEILTQVTTSEAGGVQ